MSELELQKTIKNSLKNIGCKCFQVDSGKKVTNKTRGQGLEKGFPDLFGCDAQGKMFFIEVKLWNGVISMDQVKFLVSANENKALCGVARSVEEAFLIIMGERTIHDTLEIRQYLATKKESGKKS